MYAKYYLSLGNLRFLAILAFEQPLIHCIQAPMDDVVPIDPDVYPSIHCVFILLLLNVDSKGKALNTI